MKIEVQSFVFSSLYLTQNLTKPLLTYHFIIATPTLRNTLLTRKRLPFLLECSGDQLIPFPTLIKEFLFLPSPKVLFWDQFRFLGKCPPTPPLSQH